MTNETVVSDINKSIEGAQTSAPESPKAPKRSKAKSKPKSKRVAKKTPKKSAKTKPKKGPNKALVKAAKKFAASKAEKSDKPEVRWGSLMSIDNDALMKAIKGEKNALSAQGIAKKFKCTIWTAKRSVYRAAESKGLTVQSTTRQEGKAGVASVCYYVK